MNAPLMTAILASANPATAINSVAEALGHPAIAIGLAALGIGVIGWVVYSRVRGARRDREPMNLAPRERMKAITQHAATIEKLEVLRGEVKELTRVCIDELDRRATRLERLLEAADERLRALDEATRRGPIGAAAPAQSPGSTANAVPTYTAGPIEPKRGPGRQSGAAPAILEGDSAADPLTRRIYSLADEGASPIEIARQLNEHAGKVELILALRSRRPDPSWSIATPTG